VIDKTKWTNDSRQIEKGIIPSISAGLCKFSLPVDIGYIQGNLLTLYSISIKGKWARHENFRRVSTSKSCSI